MRRSSSLRAKRVLPHQLWVLWVLGGVPPESWGSCHVNSESYKYGVRSLMKEMGILTHRLCLSSMECGLTSENMGNPLTSSLDSGRLGRSPAWKSRSTCDISPEFCECGLGSHSIKAQCPVTSTVSYECKERPVPERFGGHITSGSREWWEGSFPEIAGGLVTSALGE